MHTPTRIIMELNSANVNKLFANCILNNEMQNHQHALRVDGVLSSAVFYLPALQKETPAIELLINQLPNIFKNEGEKGGSFLQMCEDYNGELWTGEHAVMERLLLLGIAIGKMGFLLPKPLWAALPGGMPYVHIKP